MRILGWLMTIFVVSTLFGCSNYKELNEISIVLGVGIDFLPDENQYEVTYQIVNPSSIAAKGAGSNATAVITINMKGKTISEAARKHAIQFSRTNIYSHIQLVIIGEQLAKKESLNFIFDVFERDSSVRVNVPVLIARDVSVRNAMDIIPTIDKIPVRTIRGKVENAAKQLGEHSETKIYEVIEALTNNGSEPAISGISVRGNKNIGASQANLETMAKSFVELNGIAIFRKGKLIGWLDGDKKKSLQIINNQLIKTDVMIHCDGRRYTSVIVNRLRSHTSVDIKDSQPKIDVHVDAYGYISEMLCNKDISNPRVLQEYEEKAARELEQELKDGIVTAQKMKSDVFGFGEMLRQTHPAKWKNVRLQWNELFAEANVEVDVKMDIDGTGMRVKPYPY